MNTPDPAGGFGSATLHEAGGQTGALPHLIRPIRLGMRVAGPALPVSCAAGDNLWLHRAIYAAEQGEVIVCEVGDPAYGYWGEILAVAAQERGVAGLVINGGVRDTDALATRGFATFASVVAIRGTGKDPAVAGAVGEPVLLGDVRVRRGDLVVGDSDGVVVLARSVVADVLARSGAREEKERWIIERLGAGETTLDLLSLPGGAVAGDAR